LARLENTKIYAVSKHGNVLVACVKSSKIANITKYWHTISIIIIKLTGIRDDADCVLKFSEA